MMPSSMLDSCMFALTILVLLDQYVPAVQGTLHTFRFVFARSTDAERSFPIPPLAARMSQGESFLCTVI